MIICEYLKNIETLSSRIIFSNRQMGLVCVWTYCHVGHYIFVYYAIGTFITQFIVLTKSKYNNILCKTRDRPICCLQFTNTYRDCGQYK